MGSGVGARTLGTDANASAQAPTPKGVLEGPAKRLSEAGFDTATWVLRKRPREGGHPRP
jgi:hypothetical protein